jgi:integrase
MLLLARRVCPALLRYGLRQDGDQVLHRPSGVSQSSFHRGGYANRFVNPAKVVMHEMERDSCLMVCDFLGERIGETGKATHGHLQQRHERWAIVNLHGKGGHIRTVPIPLWVKSALDAWLIAGDIREGTVFRRVSRTGTVWGSKISEKLVWWIVRQRAQDAGVDRLAPHDLRRTCARLCHAAGGELEQIQFLLGHRSVETTERYLGSRQRLASAVNDRIGLEPDFAGP